MLDKIKDDFAALWKAKLRGNTFEVSTPFLMAAQKFAAVMIAKRDEHWFVCDGGYVSDLVTELCGRDMDKEISALAKEAGLKADGNVYFKECTDEKMISSLVLDVSNFAVASSLILVSENKLRMQNDALVAALESCRECAAELLRHREADLDGYCSGPIKESIAAADAALKEARR